MGGIALQREQNKFREIKGHAAENGTWKPIMAASNSSKDF